MSPPQKSPSLYGFISELYKTFKKGLTHTSQILPKKLKRKKLPDEASITMILKPEQDTHTYLQTNILDEIKAKFLNRTTVTRIQMQSKEMGDGAVDNGHYPSWPGSLALVPSFPGEGAGQMPF